MSEQLCMHLLPPGRWPGISHRRPAGTGAAACRSPTPPAHPAGQPTRAAVNVKLRQGHQQQVIHVLQPCGRAACSGRGGWLQTLHCCARLPAHANHGCSAGSAFPAAHPPARTLSAGLLRRAEFGVQGMPGGWPCSRCSVGGCAARAAVAALRLLRSRRRRHRLGLLRLQQRQLQHTFRHLAYPTQHTTECGTRLQAARRRVCEVCSAPSAAPLLAGHPRPRAAGQPPSRCLPGDRWRCPAAHLAPRAVGEHQDGHWQRQARWNEHVEIQAPGLFVGRERHRHRAARGAGLRVGGEGDACRLDWALAHW